LTDHSSEALSWSRQKFRDTDSDAIARALDVAAKALTLTDRDADADALRSQLAASATPDPRLTRAAEQLRGALEAIDAQLVELAGVAASVPGWQQRLAIFSLRIRLADALATAHPLTRSSTRSRCRAADPPRCRN
jgi:hypothetical protein